MTAALKGLLRDLRREGFKPEKDNMDIALEAEVVTRRAHFDGLTGAIRTEGLVAEDATEEWRASGATDQFEV